MEIYYILFPIIHWIIVQKLEHIHLPQKLLEMITKGQNQRQSLLLVKLIKPPIIPNLLKIVKQKYEHPTMKKIQNFILEMNIKQKKKLFLHINMNLQNILLLMIIDKNMIFPILQKKMENDIMLLDKFQDDWRLNIESLHLMTL